MTERDWNILLGQWNDSFSSTSFKAETEDKMSGRKVKILKELGNGTAKAKFFATKKHGDRDYTGFWCPKSAIISESKKHIFLAEWCKITEIKYEY